MIEVTSILNVIPANRCQGSSGSIFDIALAMANGVIVKGRAAKKRRA